eukprot:gene8650-9581_t
MDFSAEICHEFFNTALKCKDFSGDLIRFFNEVESSECETSDTFYNDGLSRYLTIYNNGQQSGILKYYKEEGVCHAFLERRGKGDLPTGVIIDPNDEVIHVFGTAASFECESNQQLCAKSKALLSYKKIFIPITCSENATDIENISNALRFILVIITWSIRMFFQNQFLWHKILERIANHREVTRKNAREFLTAFKEVDSSSYRQIDGELEKKKNAHLVTKSQNLQKFSYWLTTKQDVPEILCDMKAYKDYETCKQLMTTQEYKTFIKKTGEVVNDALDTILTQVEQENNFLLEAKRAIDAIFSSCCSDEQGERTFGQNFIKTLQSKAEGRRNQYFIETIKTSRHKCFETLRDKTLDLQTAENMLVLSEDLNLLLCKLAEPPKFSIIKDSGLKVITVSGSYVNFEEVCDKILEEKFDELRIMASEVVCINKSLKMPGMSIYIKCETLEVIGNRHLDVTPENDGFDSNNIKYSKTAGNKSTEQSTINMPGDVDIKGIVHIQSNNSRNMDCLTINSNKTKFSSRDSSKTMGNKKSNKTDVNECKGSSGFDVVDGLEGVEKVPYGGEDITTDLIVGEKIDKSDIQKQVLKAMGTIKDNLRSDIVEKSFPVARIIINHSESFIVTAKHQISNELLLVKNLLKKAKADADKPGKVEYPDVQNQGDFEKIDSLRKFLLSHSEYSIQDISALYDERKLFSNQLKGSWIVRKLDKVLKRNDDAKKRLLERNEELISVILVKLKVSWLSKFGSMLQNFESAHYEETDFGVLPIKMRLVHSNFNVVKKVLDMKEYKRTDECVLYEYNSIVNFVYDITDLQSELLDEAEVNEEMEDDEDKFSHDEEIVESEKMERDLGSDSESLHQVAVSNNDKKQENIKKESLEAHDGSKASEDMYKPLNEGLFHYLESSNTSTENSSKVQAEKLETSQAASWTKQARDKHDDSNSSNAGYNDQNIDEFAKQKERKKVCELIVTKFETDLSSRDDIKLSESIITSIRMLQYLNYEEMSTLLEILTMRILLEGSDISTDTLQWILNVLLNQTEIMWIKILTWLFGFNPVKTWASEYLVQYLIYCGMIMVEDEKTFREVFRAFQDQRWFHGLLQLTSKTEDMQLVLNVGKILKSNPYDESLMYHILESHCSKWEVILETHYACKVLLELPVDWSANSLIQANSYLDQLRMTHSKKVVDSLVGLLQNIGKTPETLVLSILRKFYTDYWELSGGTFSHLAGKPINVWEEVLDAVFFSNEDRSLDCLIEMICKDENNSERFHNARESAAKTAEDKFTHESDRWKTLLTNTVADGKVIDTFGEEFAKDWEHHFDEKFKGSDNTGKAGHLDKLRSWSDSIKTRAASIGAGSKQFLLDNISEIFVHIEIGISLITGYKLRQVQRLSLLLMLLSKDRALLQQVATGEGKTIIIVGFCIAKALLGHTVDVLTSSSVLAERDASDPENVAIYQLFSVSVSHNGSNDVDKRTAAYKCDIVYGEIGDFQRDLLLQQFYSLQYIGERKSDVLTVDEADSMLLDNAENVLYLSHDIPDLDALEPIFVYVWSFVHGKEMYGTKSDVDTIESAVMNAMYGSVRRDGLSENLCCLGGSGEKVANEIWNLMITKAIIDDKGRILKKDEVMKNAFELNLPTFENVIVESSELEGLVLNYLKDTLKKGSEITVPNHLENFVALHLKAWIENAFKAKTMEERCHYVIDKDGRNAEDNGTAKVIIMDTDTGKEQFNMIWSEGLHQFLQLKHGCKCTALSLKAVFSSNTQFFKAYEGSLYGLTGTLGSLLERKVLQKMFDVDYVNVPTFRAKRFSQDEDRIFYLKEEWLSELAKRSKEIAQERPVLVICETIQVLEMVQCLLKDGSVQLYVYKHSYQPIDPVKRNEKIGTGCIILATNLAGRGTDIKISDQMEAKGGLHVILTYLPRNIRVQEQAFGRTARKGQSGSGQLFIYAGATFEDEMSDLARLSLLTKKRNSEEKDRLSLVVDHYEKRIKREEHFFAKFRELFSKIVELKRNEDTELRKIIESACINQWSFWLVSLAKLLDSSIEEQESSWEAFSEQVMNCVNLKSANDDVSGIENLKIVQGISQRISLGLYLLEKENYDAATNVFKAVIDAEPNFSEAAHYYLIYALVKQTNLKTADDKLKARLHLSNAKKILNARIDVYSQLGGIIKGVNVLHSRGNDDFTAVTIYNKQKENLVNLLSYFKGTIEDMLGHDMDELALENAIGEKMLAKEILGSNLVTKSNFFEFKGDEASAIQQEYNNFIDNRLKHLYEWYSLYQPEVKDRITALQKEKRPLSESDFINVLPNREEFWDSLKESGCLEDVKSYIIIDIDKLAKNNAVKDSLGSFFDFVMRMSASDELHGFEEATAKAMSEEGDNEEEKSMSENLPLCLYPEDLKDLKDKKKIALKVEDKDKLDDFLDSRILDAYGVISSNEVGTLRTRKKVRFKKYDEFKMNDLLEVPGLSNDIASEIFSELNLQPKTKTGLPQIDKIVLGRHKKFEIDVKNLVKKKFQYREYFEKTLQDGVIPFEELGCQTHEKLWKDLHDLEIIIPTQAEASLKKKDFQARIEKEKETLEKGYSGFFYKFAWKGADEIAQSMVQLSSTLSRFSKVDASFKEFVEVLDDKTKSDARYETELVSNMGLIKVIILEKKKSWWSTFWKIVGIIALGIAQICVGVIIEVFTCGAGTFVAEGFIGEGVGDLMFAAECIISWHCSMKEYLKQKAISLAITVLTCGVGAWFARGAKFSRFGSKIGKEFESIAGKELLEKAGTRRVAKEAVKRVGKKVAEATALGLTNAAVSKIVEKLLKKFLKDICSGILDCFRNIVDDTELKDAIKAMYCKVGEEKTRTTALRVCNNSLSTEEGVLQDKAVRIFDGISKGFENALKKMTEAKVSEAKLEVFKEVTELISKIAKLAPYLKAVDEMKNCVENFKLKMPMLILGEAEKLPIGKTFVANEANVNSILNEITNCLRDRVEEILEHQIIDPLLHQQVSKVVHYSGQNLRQKYRDMEAHFQWKKFRSMISSGGEAEPIQHEKPEEHVNLTEKIQAEKVLAMVHLQRRVRDPDLYAEVLKQTNVPMGIHEVQALSTAFNREIRIIQNSEDGHTIIQDEFKPGSEGQKNPPITIYFRPDKNGGTGHFSAEPLKSRTNVSSIKNNCLLDTIKEVTGVHVTRSQVASIVRSTPEIRHDISRAFHKHYIDVGGTGGAERNDKQKERLKENYKRIQNKVEDAWKRGETYTLTGDEKESLLDHPQVASLVWKEKKADRISLSSAKSLNKTKATAPRQNSKEEKRTSKAKNEAINKTRNNAAISTNARRSVQSRRNSKEKQTLEAHEVKVGNHECVGREHTVKLMVMDLKNKANGVQAEGGGIKILWIDLSKEMRLDIRYCVFEHENTVHGHPKAVCSQESLEARDQKTKGSKEKLHTNVGEKALKESDSADHAAIMLLNHHLDAIGSKEKFKKSHEKYPDFFKNCYTATGHDLSEPGQRARFFTGLERERYKIEQCIRKLGGTPISSTTLGNTESDKNYKLYIEKELNACDDMEKFGDVLRKPAPHGEW